MADYRDEKETLRRRIVVLEAQVENLRADDVDDAGALETLRHERDALDELRRDLEDRNAELSDVVAKLSRELAKREGTALTRDWTPARWAGVGAWLSLALAIPIAFYDGGMTLVPLGIAIGLGLTAAVMGQRERRGAREKQRRPGRRDRHREPPRARVRIHNDTSAPPTAEAQAKRRRRERRRGGRR